jgi:outer membrane protein OmpA-like peptidoglycan-associated protein
LVCLSGYSQMIIKEKTNITPDNVLEIGGVSSYNGELYLLLQANIRYDGKDIEASESKSIARKYKVWDVYCYHQQDRKLENANKKWNTADASPNGFCLINDSTVVYSNNKSQLTSNNNYFKSLFLKTNNSKFHFTDPTWDTAHKRLYFSSDLPGGKGGMDIWYIETCGNDAGIPVNAGDLNSASNELSPALNSDTLLLFVSNRQNNQYDISLFDENKQVVNSEEITVENEFFTCSSGKELLYFVSSKEKTQTLWKSKYDIRKNENIKKITPAVTEELPSTPVLSEPEQVKQPEALPDDPEFRLDNYFGTAKYTLTPFMKDSLDKITTMLNANPTLNIVICGHSSPDGPEDKNMLLSFLRVSEAYKWLLGKGIKPERIFRVYGGEYLYSNMDFSRMFSIFTVSETDLPNQTVVVPASAIGNPAKLYPFYGIDKDEVDYWRYILKKRLPVDDQSLLLLPIKDMHYVLPKETLYSLSKQYGSTLEKMIGANGLKDAIVGKGKILYIPVK